MEVDTICRVRKTFGPISPGTLVKVIGVPSQDNNEYVVELLSRPSQKFNDNLLAHKIFWNGFHIEEELLEPRRYSISQNSKAN